MDLKRVDLPLPHDARPRSVDPRVTGVSEKYLQVSLVYFILIPINRAIDRYQYKINESKRQIQNRWQI